MAQAKLVVLGAVVNAQQAFMRAYLEMAGDQWDKDEDAKVAFAASEGLVYERRTRMQLAAQCKLEDEFLDMLGTLLSSNHLELCLPMPARNVAIRSLAFRLISVAGAMCHQNFTTAHKNYPFRTFASALSSDAGSFADALQGERQCRLDGWTLAFRDHYGERLGSAEAIADLQATALMAFCETAQIEAFHAKVRRRVVRTSVQTNPQHLEHTSADFVMGSMTRDMKLSSGQPPQQQLALPAGRAEVGSAGGGPQAAKRTPGGGGQRAFIHSRCAGRAKADFPALAAEYARLSAAERAPFIERGRLASIAHRAGHAAFGMTAREAERARKKRLREEDEAALRGRARDELRAKIGRTSGAIEDLGQQLVAASPTQQVSIPAALEWEDFMVATQAAVTAVNTGKASLAVESSAALQMWADRTTSSAATAEGFREALPSELAKSLGVQPPGAESFRRWRLQMDRMQGLACRAVSVRGETGVGKALHRCLDKDWSQKHQLLSGERPSIAERRKPSAACMEAGVCVCSPTGKVLRYMHDRLLELTKELCPRSSETRSLLVDGRVAYCFIGQEATPQQSGMGLAASGDEVSLVGKNTDELVLVHVALHRLSPFRPTFQKLVLLGFEEHRCCCKALPEWQTVWEAVDGLNKNLRWSLRLFRLAETAEPLTAFSPDIVNYSRLAPASPITVFWNGADDCERGRLRHFQCDADDDAGAGDEAIGEATDYEDDEGEGDDEASSEGGPGLFFNSDDEALAPPAAEEPAEASSSGDAQMAPASALSAPTVAQPVRQVPRPQRASGRGQVADVQFAVPGGEIRYYARTRRFAAHCENAAHGNCRREKVSTGRPGRGQGRPLGYLMAWLAEAFEHDTHAEHMDNCVIISLERRQRGREALRAIGGSEELFAGERQSDNEGEPEHHP